MAGASEKPNDKGEPTVFPSKGNDSVYDELSMVEAFCEEYIEVCRSGDPPPMNEFAASCTGFESQVMELLPTILMMEKARNRSAGKRRDGRVSAGPEKLSDLADFEIIREIGRGGMGIVYEANQISLDRRVALKVLPKHVLSERQVKQFQIEAATAAKLHHTNIAPVYGVGEKHGVHYFAMQLLVGKTLEQCIKDDTQFTMDQVISIGCQVAAALQFAHGQGVFHRDIKPANLIMDANSTVWVTDFGLAVTKEGTGQNPGKQVGGTLRYMPPEAFDKYDEAMPGYDLRRADVYSLAITLIELCSGTAAFESSGVLDLTEAIQVGRLQPLKISGKPMRSDFESVLRKASATNPLDRYDTAQGFFDDLVNVSEGRPVSSREISTLGQLVSWGKRDPYLAFAISLVVFSFVSTTLVVTLSFLRVQDSLVAETTQRAKAEQASQLGAQSIDRIFRQFAFDLLFDDETHETELTKPRLSRGSAAMLSELAGFYDQLALENDDPTLPVKAILARCRVGDIHQRLGDFEVAVSSFRDALSVYSRFTEMGQISQTPQVTVELARIRNQLGYALKASGKIDQANREHMNCIDVLNEFIDARPDEPNLAHRLELARSYYLMAYLPRPGMNPQSLPPLNIKTEGDLKESRTTRLESINVAVSILDRLLKFDGNRDAGESNLLSKKAGTPHLTAGQEASCKYLLALCHRELAGDNWSIRTDEDRSHQAEAIQILENLSKQRPSHMRYVFELMRTMAEINVFQSGISEPDVEEAYAALRMSVEMGQALVARQPDVIEYRVETLHGFFKLSKIANAKSKFVSESKRASLLKEQENACRKALREQSFLSRQYPDSLAFRVWVAKFSLELARCPSMDGRRSDKNRLISRAIQILFNLSEQNQKITEIATILDEARQMSNELLMDSQEINR